MRTGCVPCMFTLLAVSKLPGKDRCIVSALLVSCFLPSYIFTCAVSKHELSPTSCGQIRIMRNSGQNLDLVYISICIHYCVKDIRIHKIISEGILYVIITQMKKKLCFSSRLKEANFILNICKI